MPAVLVTGHHCWKIVSHQFTLFAEEPNNNRGKKKSSLYQMLLSGSSTDGSHTLAPKESPVAVLEYRNPTYELNNSE